MYRFDPVVNLIDVAMNCIPEGSELNIAVSAYVVY